MLKTYLDWNIIADLRDDKLSLSLGNFIDKCKFNTLFPYSNVHFQDLYNRGRRDFSRVETDLSIIDKVSNSFYLAYDEKEDRIETQYGSAVDYYKHYKSESFIYKVAEKFIDTLGKFLLSKDYIRKAQKLLGLDPKVVNNEQDVIEYFNKVLPNTDFQKGFLELIEHTYKEYYRKEELTSHDYLVAAYLNLHILGFQTEKLPFRNILNDASHLFFGSACDFFITHDKKLIKKASILFKFFNIDCKILSFDEFLVEIEKFTIKPNVDFLESIGVSNWDIESFEQLEVKNPRNSLFRKTLQPRIFGIFNEVRLLKSENHTIYIFMVEKQFHKFFCYGYEFQYLTDWLTHFFGNDDDGFGDFNETDGKMVGNKFWYGRNWSFNGNYIVNFKFYGMPILQVVK